MEISFAHNVYDRAQSLRNTIAIERSYFPEAKIYVAYNNKAIEKELFAIPDVKYFYFPESTHKIGCTNGAIHSIKMALETMPDVIIFSHDDVYISDINVVREHIENIKKGYDFIGRSPQNLPDIGTDYIMMEAMFFSYVGARNIYHDMQPFTNEQEINKDLRGSISPEAHMYEIVSEHIPFETTLKIPYHHENVNYNFVLEKVLGFHHKNAGQRGWKEA